LTTLKPNSRIRTMLELIDGLMTIIMMMVLAAFLLVTCPIWILPYIIYTAWRNT